MNVSSTSTRRHQLLDKSDAVNEHKGHTRDSKNRNVDIAHVAAFGFPCGLCGEQA